MTGQREGQASARDLLEWNGVLPTVSVFESTPEGHATKLYSISADYGWAERILCDHCYEQDAEAIAAAIREALA